MATDAQRHELEGKVAAMVSARFGGDYRAAFAHFDADGDGAISAAELKVLLADAGVGSGWTRWAWVAGVMAELDANRDRTVTWDEFAAAFEGGRAEPPGG